MFAVQPSADRVMVGTVLPVDWVNVTPPAPIAAEYLTESAKYASSAVTRLRRSDFIEARYAFSFVLANRSEERRVGSPWSAPRMHVASHTTAQGVDSTTITDHHWS